jgi:hypothetical protein
MAYTQNDYQMGGYGETEEERRRRLEQEAADAEAAAALAKPTPVKETRTIDPVTGEVSLKIEGNERDLSAANPLTPTVVPVAPVNPTDARLAAGTQAAPLPSDEQQRRANGLRSLVSGSSTQLAAPALLAAPAQAPTAAVAPDSNAGFQRMLQVESGNRDYTAQGAPVTSPKGAMFAAQVMPNTAQNPGYGVRPAANQTPEEYNRVGREYYDAMLKKYAGNEDLARAAYNAGPGRVDQAIAQGRQQGVDPLSLLPQETQNYIQKTAAPAAAAVPVAQNFGTLPTPGPGVQVASTVPVPGALPTPVAPGSVPVQGASSEGTAGEAPAQAAIQTAQDRFLTIQDNTDELMKYAADTTVPKHLQDRARETAYEKLIMARQEQKAQDTAQKLIAEGDGKKIANALQGRGAKGEEGSWLKMIMLGFISPELAGVEATKLGLKASKWDTGLLTDDKGNTTAVELQRRADGKLLGGTRLDGTPLTTAELERAAAQTASAKGVEVGADTYLDPTGKVPGNWVLERKAGGSVYRQVGSNKIATEAQANALRKTGVQGTLGDQGSRQIQKQNIDLAGDWARLQMEVQKAGPIAGNKYIGEFNRKYGTNFGAESITGGPPQISTETGQMVQTTPGASAAPAAPVSSAAVNKPIVSGAAGASPAAIAAGVDVNKDVNTAEQKQFVEKVIPEVQKKGDDGKFVADTRRTQVGMLTGPNSAIMGIYRGTGSSYDKARAVLRDAVSGVYARTEDPNGLRLSEDLRNVSIPAEQLSALKEFVQMNTGINAKTLAENAGEGPKSDADMRLNQAANMTNIGDLPAFAALTGLTRSQFAGDINKRKQDFLNSNRDTYKTQSQLEAVWGKEKDLLNRQYEGIYKARLNYIDAQMVQKFGQDWRKKKDDDTQAFYRNASIHSFNVLPTPNYDTQTQKFVYPTEQSKLAAMRAITGK